MMCEPRKLISSILFTNIELVQFLLSFQRGKNIEDMKISLYFSDPKFDLLEKRERKCLVDLSFLFQGVRDLSDNVDIDYEKKKIIKMYVYFYSIL